jgi:hypothetical protein
MTPQRQRPLVNADNPFLIFLVLFCLIILAGLIIFCLCIPLVLIADALESAKEEKRLKGVLEEEEREKQAIDKERKSTAHEYKELVGQFAELVSNCTSPWDELKRIATALHGNSGFCPFALEIERDVLRILCTLSAASGNAANGLGRMYHAILVRLKPETCDSLQKCIETVMHQEPGAELPSVLKPLSAFDEMRKSNLAADAAVAYVALVLRASDCCPASLAVEVLRNKYIELLRPYIPAEVSGNDSSSGNGHCNKSSTQFNGNCSLCAKYFPVLRLSPDAGENETKSAYRNFAKIYHPDRFEGKSERQTAEEELKQINEAYGHIAEHFESQRL